MCMYMYVYVDGVHGDMQILYIYLCVYVYHSVVYLMLLVHICIYAIYMLCCGIYVMWK